MSNLEIWLLTAVALLWCIGGHATYLALIATGSAAGHRRSLQIINYIAWPFLFLVAIYKKR